MSPLLTSLIKWVRSAFVSDSPSERICIRPRRLYATEREKAISSNDLKDFVYRWNVMFPADKWWREKYHIPFNSERHANICLLDQVIEYVEEDTHKKWSEGERIDRSYNYVPGIRDYIRDVTETYTDKDYDRIYANMDLGNIVER